MTAFKQSSMVPNGVGLVVAFGLSSLFIHFVRTDDPGQCEDENRESKKGVVLETFMLIHTSLPNSHIDLALTMAHDSPQLSQPLTGQLSTRNVLIL